MFNIILFCPSTLTHKGIKVFRNVLSLYVHVIQNIKAEQIQLKTHSKEFIFLSYNMKAANIDTKKVKPSLEIWLNFKA